MLKLELTSSDLVAGTCAMNGFERWLPVGKQHEG